MKNENLSQREQEIAILQDFLPDGFSEFVYQILNENPVNFKIVNPRSTKLGDFKADIRTGTMQITVNGNLNPYSFLVTTLHEVAHLRNHIKHSNRVKPHGEEWKNEFRQLIFDAVHHTELPKDIEIALMNSLTSMKASSCTDVNLYKVLKKYDNNDFVLDTIESLQKNATFVFRGKQFRLIAKRRTRYLCEDISTGKQYLFHALTEIKNL